jgi:UDP-N-acetylglucosamine 2-epimerase
MLKVMTIVGTRPELIKMSRVISEFDEHTKHILVHTGQNYDYELNQIFFDDLGIRVPDYFLEANSETVAHTIARVIERSYEVMSRENPDAVLLYGDTNSCLSVISAKRLKIPVFHMEAGNRCFDQRVPEELNRKVLDHLSDINLVLSEQARNNLLAEGIRSETIMKTGSHMREVLDYYMPRISESDILLRLNLQPNKYLIVSAHREENVEVPEKLEKFIHIINALAENYDCPIIVSTHPRTRKKLAEMGAIGILHKHIKMMKPFGFFDYIKLQCEALCVISDSGTIAEESSILNLPSVTIREAHERPESMDNGIMIMADMNKESVLDAIRIVLIQHNKINRVMQPVADYEGGAVSKKLLRIVVSYIGYINRTVWKKIN